MAKVPSVFVQSRFRPQCFYPITMPDVQALAGMLQTDICDELKYDFQPNA